MVYDSKVSCTRGTGSYAKGIGRMKLNTMHRVSPLILAVACIMLTGCVADFYVSGQRMGELPSSRWNVNGVLFGARGGPRSAHWSLLHDYVSVAYADAHAADGWKFKLLGPYLPTIIGALDINGQTGFVTPIYSQHWGNLSSFAIGPIFFPVFRLDEDDQGEYWKCSILGLIHFGSQGWKIGLGNLGLSAVREPDRYLYLEVKSAKVMAIEQGEDGEPIEREIRVPAGVPDVWDAM